MPSPRYDLHVHTHASQGTLAPRDVVALAVDRGLAGIAITDVHTVSGIHEATVIAPALGVRVVPGVKLACVDPDGHELHMLGYFIDRDHPQCRELIMRASSAANAVSMADVIRGIHACGGAAVLAHPGCARGGLNIEQVQRAIAAGIDGIEVDHPDHSEDDIRICAALADEHNLVQTAGSDDHDAAGSRLGCRTVSATTLDDLEARAARWSEAQ